jgi:hypothetical protein
VLKVADPKVHRRKSRTQDDISQPGKKNELRLRGAIASKRLEQGLPGRCGRGEQMSGREDAV